MTGEYETVEVLQPHLAVRASDLADRVVLVRTAAQAERAARQLRAASIRAANRQYTTVTGHARGRDVSIVSTGLGGPSVAIAIEETVRAGARAMVLVDTAIAGADASTGEVVLATGAVRSDGTSCEYFPIELPAVADFRLYSAVRQAAGEQGVAVVEALVRSVDRLSDERDDEDDPGVVVAGIDMGTAVAYTLAQRHRCPIICVLRTASLEVFAEAPADDAFDRLIAVAIGGLAIWEPSR